MGEILPKCFPDTSELSLNVDALEQQIPHLAKLYSQIIQRQNPEFVFKFNTIEYVVVVHKDLNI